MDALFATRTTREGRQRLAVILRRLTTLSRDVRENISSALASLRNDEPAKEAKGKGNVGKEKTKLQADLERAERVQEEVEKYGERFEKECLRLFDRSYRKGDVRLMAVRSHAVMSILQIS
jgi:exocyst complex component 5